MHFVQKGKTLTPGQTAAALKQKLVACELQLCACSCDVKAVNSHLLSLAFCALKYS
jgi:hypothetical protein